MALSLSLAGWEPDGVIWRNTLSAAYALCDAGATVEEVQIPIRREDVDRAATVHCATICGPSIAAIVAEHRDVMTPYAIAFGESMVLESPGAFLEGPELEGVITGAFGPLLERYDALICPTLTFRPCRSRAHGMGVGPESEWVHSDMTT